MSSLLMYDHIEKIIIVGDSCVGKSNIMLRFTEKTFLDDSPVTIGVEFSTKIVSCNGKGYKLQLWDTAGQEAFRSIVKAYYRNSSGAIIVYDISNRTTFESVTYWMEEIKEVNDEDIPIMLIGNKNDTYERDVTFEEGEEFAKNNNMIFFECSAKNDVNVLTVFNELVKIIDDKNVKMKLNNNYPINDNNIVISNKSSHQSFFYNRC
jgi:small GTP-binding protein